MHSFVRSCAAAAASVVLASSVAFAASPSPGYVDFGEFSPAAGQQFVEVELDGALLKLAAVFANREDPEIGQLIGNLERVRVNVLGLDDATRTDAAGRVEEVRQTLGSQGWKRVVSVKEPAGDDVAIFLKQASDDTVQGVVVTVISGGSEAVLINIVGNVALEQIAALGERLDIAPLRKLDLAAID